MTDQIEPVQEGRISFCRCSLSFEVNGALVLQNHAVAIRQNSRNRSSRIAVSIANGTLPDNLRLLTGLIEVNLKRTNPAAIAIIVVGERPIAFFSKLDGS